jgi:hypothetical protein
VKIVAVIQAVNYPAMISKKNPVKQPTAHRSPAHRSTASSSSVHSNTSHIPQWMRTTGFQSPHTDIIEVERDGDGKQVDMFKVERDGLTKGNEPTTKKAAKRTALAMQTAEEPIAKPDDEKEDYSDEDSSDEEEKPAANASPANPVAMVTDEREENRSEDHIAVDNDAWRFLKPTKPNPTRAATTQKLNSKKTRKRPGTWRPTQELNKIPNTISGTRRPVQNWLKRPIRQKRSLLTKPVRRLPGTKPGGRIASSTR